MITGSIARSATCRYLIYSEADFEVFAPQGRHVAPIGVKFGAEEGTCGPSSALPVKFGGAVGEIWRGGGDHRSPPPRQISPQSVQRVAPAG